MADDLAKRHWYQFSLRALLVVTVLASLGLGLLRLTLEQARKEKQAVEELEKLGASTDDWVGWREILLGPKYAPVVQVDLRGTRDIDAALKHLQVLTTVEDLALSGTGLTDTHLEHISGLTGLRSLDLCNTQISDSGLVHLKALTNLAWLDLGNTRITNEGLNELQQALPNCTIHH